MWTSSTRSKAQGSIALTWLLLADYDADAVKYAKMYKACQIHADFIHQPLELVHLIVTTWPFEAWGIDIIEPISPPSVRGHRFTLVITDYL